MKSIWTWTFIFLMMSQAIFAQEGLGTAETLSIEPSTDLGDGEGVVNVPLNTDEWILVLSGLSLGVYKMFKAWTQYRRMVS